MFCKKCGEEVKDEALFCPKCGCDLRDDRVIQDATHNYIIFAAIGIILVIAAVSAIFIFRAKQNDSDTAGISISSETMNNSPSFEMDVAAPSSDTDDMKEEQADNTISPVYSDETGSMDSTDNTLPESNYEEVEADEEMEGTAAEEEANENSEEKIIVADGYYETDADFIGNLSDDGKELTITTSLGHFDPDQNRNVLDYDRNTYVFPVSEDCECSFGVDDIPLAEVLDEVVNGINTHYPINDMPLDLKVENGEIVFFGLYS